MTGIGRIFPPKISNEDCAPSTKLLCTQAKLASGLSIKVLYRFIYFHLSTSNLWYEGQRAALFSVREGVDQQCNSTINNNA